METQKRIILLSSKDKFSDAYEVEENVCFIYVVIFQVISRPTDLQ